MPKKIETTKSRFDAVKLDTHDNPEQPRAHGSLDARGQRARSPGNGSEFKGSSSEHVPEACVNWYSGDSADVAHCPATSGQTSSRLKCMFLLHFPSPVGTVICRPDAIEDARC